MVAVVDIGSGLAQVNGGKARSTVFGTAHCEEGLKAFGEKRKPVWGKA